MRAFAATIFLLLSLCRPAYLCAYEVLVIKGAEIKPYQDALEGFKSSCGCSVSELPLSEADRSSLAAKIPLMKPDVILAIGMEALRRAQSLTDVPIVYTMIPSPLPAGSSQKNISGVSMVVSPERQIDTMLEVFPNAKRIGIVYDPQRGESFVKEAIQHAGARGTVLIVKKASKPGDVPTLVDSLKDQIDLFWMIPDITVVTPESVNALLLFSFQNKVPVFTFASKYVDMGAAAALTVDPFDLGAQAGEIARKLSADRGRPPVHAAPRKTVLTINRTVAAKMGIKISEASLKKAQEVR